MFYFTKYANDKFDLLNKHKVYFTREQIEDVLKLPEKTKKIGKNLINYKEEIGVVYQKDGEDIKVITFYPVK